LAPEADGTFDVTTNEGGVEGEPRLKYVKYEVPRRVNNSIGTPEWNVFPSWKDQHPKAVELAEVYSLGSTMWLLLEQVALNHVDGVEDYSSEVIHRTNWSKDIPDAWKDIVAVCVKLDPNERIGMKQLLDFWKAEHEIFQQ